MKNSDIIQNVVSYISTIMKKRDISQKKLSEMCEKNGDFLTDRSISNMIKRPSSITISTLLKVCDPLDLNLSSIFHSMEIAKTEESTRKTYF